MAMALAWCEGAGACDYRTRMPALDEKALNLAYEVLYGCTSRVHVQDRGLKGDPGVPCQFERFQFCRAGCRAWDPFQHRRLATGCKHSRGRHGDRRKRA